jgi:hypothetical protein
MHSEIFSYYTPFEKYNKNFEDTTRGGLATVECPAAGASATEGSATPALASEGIAMDFSATECPPIHALSTDVSAIDVPANPAIDSFATNSSSIIALFTKGPAVVLLHPMLPQQMFCNRFSCD